MAISYGYGFFIGGDPRKFVPDTDCNTPEELENHRLACEAFDRGNEAEVAQLIESGCNTIRLRCLVCHEEVDVARDEDCDPPTAVIAEMYCEKCEPHGAKDPPTFYFDADGNEVNQFTDVPLWVTSEAKGDTNG